MNAHAQHGYLLLADISGYTSFVAGTELDHSHEILSDLLETVCMPIEKLLTIHKLEGDAVFAYAPEALFARGETLLELVEATYVAFRDRQTDIKRATTCTCRACQNIPGLDLKFILHHGDYIIQQVHKIREMVGSDVNLIHRLSKNYVSEATGWRAYLMITERCREHLNLQLEGWHEQSESYEHLGEVKTFNIDLHRRYAEIKEAKRVQITPEEADLEFTVDFPTPPAVTWEWLQDPNRRNAWNGGVVHWHGGERPGGRAGAGASNHCAHGKSLSTEVIVDWRPFKYSTTDSYDNGKKIFSETVHLEPMPDGGTHVTSYSQIYVPLPRPIRRLVARAMILGRMKYEQMMRKAAELAGEEFRTLTPR